MFEGFGRVTLISVVLACLAAIIIHEAFHMFAAHIFGVALYSFRPTLVGIRARLKNTRSFKKQTVIYFAGPLGNFIVAICLYKTGGFLSSLSEANIAIGLFNLLPIYPLDGGQILLILLYKLMGSSRAFRIAKKLAIVLKVFLFIVGILQIVLFKNPSLLIAAVILPGTRLMEEAVSFMKLENLLNRKQRILKKGVYFAGIIVVMEDMTIGDVMQRLDYDRFHLIYILNRDMEIIGLITEQDIIKAFEKYSSSDKITNVLACKE
ncbi:MAG TPA: CBS domain-containing protein [Clostridiaceae bacterium]|nr:CBS domain-containing protein [Clostridiaceae bacterium]